MDNFVLVKKNSEIAELSAQLGFSRTLFLDGEFIFITDGRTRDLLNQIALAQKNKLITISRPSTEEKLRFMLEKTKVNIILGVEQIHAKDSVHFLRSGLDPVLCAIAAQQGKTIAFSFHDIITSSNQTQLLARMRLNILLCRKYGVKMLWSTFAHDRWELRSVRDLEVFWRVLGGDGIQR